MQNGFQKYGHFCPIRHRILESTYNLQSQFLNYLSQLDVPLIHTHIFGRCHFKSPSYKKTTKNPCVGTNHPPVEMLRIRFFAPTCLTFSKSGEKPSPPKSPKRIQQKKKHTNLKWDSHDQPTNSSLPGSPKSCKISTLRMSKKPWSGWELDLEVVLFKRLELKILFRRLHTGWKSGPWFLWRKYINCIHHLRFMLQFAAMFVYPRV